MISRRDIPHYVRIVAQKFHERLSTAAMRLTAWYWGIALGHGSQFVGSASLVRCRGSRIEIGAYGRFLSATRLNRHGLNRPVMVTTLRPKAEIVIGSHVGMSGTVVCAAESVHIGDRVMLGANTTITDTDSHPIDYRMRFPVNHGLDPRFADTETHVAPVVLEDDVFVGMHSIILKGVTIGRGAVVAAGSVVTKSVLPGEIVGGAPARVIGTSSQEYLEREFPLNSQGCSFPMRS